MISLMTTCSERTSLAHSKAATARKERHKCFMFYTAYDANHSSKDAPGEIAAAQSQDGSSQCGATAFEYREKVPAKTLKGLLPKPDWSADCHVRAISSRRNVGYSEMVMNLRTRRSALRWFGVNVRLR